MSKQDSRVWYTGIVSRSSEDVATPWCFSTEKKCGLRGAAPYSFLIAGLWFLNGCFVHWLRLFSREKSNVLPPYPFIKLHKHSKSPKNARKLFWSISPALIKVDSKNRLTGSFRSKSRRIYFMALWPYGMTNFKKCRLTENCVCIIRFNIRCPH